MNIELPSNEKYEFLILAAIQNSINAANDLLFTMNVEDFHYPKHRQIFIEMKYLFSKIHSLDLNILITQMTSNKTLTECGGINYLLEISQSYQSSCDYLSYSKDLRNLSNLRQLIYLTKESIDSSTKPDSNFESISKDLFMGLFKLQGHDHSKTHKPSAILDKYSEAGNFIDHMQWMRDRVNAGLTPYTGVSCNFHILDRVLGFFRPEFLYYVGARTSMGKTTFMLNLINGILSSKDPVTVGVFSLEMPANILLAKLLCLMADVKFSSYEDMVISPQEKYKIEQCAAKMHALPLLLEDQEDVTISRVRARARRLVQNEGVKIIFIDYLTRIKSDTKYSSKHLQVDEVSKGLQSMAKELKVPVICLAQLNRATIQRSNPTPSLADFRESGSIEEDCDAAILLHRPDYYNASDFPGQIQVIVAKNRIRGQLRKIAFSKSFNSELYLEDRDIGAVVREIKSQQSNPFDESS